MCHHHVLCAGTRASYARTDDAVSR
jgi:hypothetical protein